MLEVEEAFERILAHFEPLDAVELPVLDCLGLILAEDIDRFIADAPPGWRVHRLSGDRAGTWSVSLTGNWRITFHEADGYIDRLNLEDYL